MELRWVERNSIEPVPGYHGVVRNITVKVLQYRTHEFIDNCNGSYTDWTDWQDVPTATEE